MSDKKKSIKVDRKTYEQLVALSDRFKRTPEAQAEMLIQYAVDEEDELIVRKAGFNR